MTAYRELLDDPERGPGICEDYRAGAGIDRAHDDADRAAGQRITCPLLVLWSAAGALPRFYGDVLDVWRPWADDLRGEAWMPATSSSRTSPSRSPPRCSRSSNAHDHALTATPRGMTVTTQPPTATRSPGS